MINFYKNLGGRYRHLIYALQILGFIGCAISPKNTSPQAKSKNEIESQVHYIHHDGYLKKNDLAKKMVHFKGLLGNGGPKSKADWKLHDELLQTYTRLKTAQGSPPNQIVVPAHSKVIFSLPSFCLNSSRAGPSENERFKWKKGDPEIPYFKKTLEYAQKHPEMQSQIQELIWNLQNKTRWEEYPDQLKLILREIDPNASAELPSRIKDRLKDAASDLLSEYVPGVQTARDAVSLIEGKYYTFDEVRRDIESRKSSEPIEADLETLEGIPDTSLYAETRSTGFSNQAVTLYNPTDQTESINLNDYYLESPRKDVQRIGPRIAAYRSV
jgi:hypothetical protein